MHCTVCNKSLNKHNKIGTCRKHRSKSPIRRQYELEWQSRNKERYAEAKKRWGQRNLKYFCDYRNNNANNKIAHSLRTRLRLLVTRGSAVKNLGCSVPELIKHLESKFQDGMSWQNYGKWHIDHIRPLSSFNLSDPNELAIACNYQNLQPLWAVDNIRKNAKWEYPSKSARAANAA